MTNTEKAMYTAIEKLVTENKHDAAVRFTLLVYGIDAEKFMPGEYVYDVFGQIGSWLYFYTVDEEGHYSEICVDLDEGTYRTRIDEEGWGWTGWYSC